MGRSIAMVVAVLALSCGGVSGFVNKQVSRAERVRATCGSDNGEPSELAALAPTADMRGPVTALLHVGQIAEGISALRRGFSQLALRVEVVAALLDDPALVAAASDAEMRAGTKRGPDNPLAVAIRTKFDEKRLEVIPDLEGDIASLLRAIETSSGAAIQDAKAAIASWRAIARIGAISNAEGVLAQVATLHQTLVKAVEKVRLDVSGQCDFDSTKYSRNDWLPKGLATAAACMQSVTRVLATVLGGDLKLTVAAEATVPDLATRAGYDAVAKPYADLLADNPSAKSYDVAGALRASRERLDALAKQVNTVRAAVPGLDAVLEPPGRGAQDLVATVQMLSASVTTVEHLAEAVQNGDLGQLRELLFESQPYALVDSLLRWIVRMVGLAEQRLNTLGQSNVFVSLGVEVGKLAGLDDMIAAAFARAIVAATDRVGVPRAALIARTCGVIAQHDQTRGELVALFLDELAISRDPPTDDSPLLSAALAQGVARGRITTAAIQAGVRLSRAEEDALAEDLGARLLPYMRPPDETNLGNSRPARRPTTEADKTAAAAAAAELEVRLTAAFTTEVITSLAADLRSPALDRMVEAQQALDTQLVASYGELRARMGSADDREARAIEDLSRHIKEVTTHAESDRKAIVREQDRLDELTAWCLDVKPDQASGFAWSCTPVMVAGKRTVAVHYQVTGFPDCGFELGSLPKAKKDDRAAPRATIESVRASLHIALVEHPDWELLVGGYASTTSPAVCMKKDKLKKLRETERQWWQGHCPSGKCAPARDDELNRLLADQRAHEAIELLTAKDYTDDAKARTVQFTGEVVLEGQDFARSVMFILQAK